MGVDSGAGDVYIIAQIALDFASDFDVVRMRGAARLLNGQACGVTVGYVSGGFGCGGGGGAGGGGARWVVEDVSGAGGPERVETAAAAVAAVEWGSRLICRCRVGAVCGGAYRWGGHRLIVTSHHILSVVVFADCDRGFVGYLYRWADFGCSGGAPGVRPVLSVAGRCEYRCRVARWQEYLGRWRGPLITAPGLHGSGSGSRVIMWRVVTR